MDERILLDSKSVYGIIYAITNSLTGKKYIGQTVSHRKNREKWRLFGAEGRLRDHISEALCDTKKKQCTLLNNSIRKHGASAFSVCVLESQISLSNLDNREIFHISDQQTLAPNGYNLTSGGKNPAYTLCEPRITCSKSHVKDFSRKPETRLLIGKQIQRFYELNPEKRMVNSQRALKQHLEKRLKLFSEIRFMKSNLEEYITIFRNNVTVSIDGITTGFVGKYESLEQKKERALEFLKILYATLPNNGEALRVLNTTQFTKVL